MGLSNQQLLIKNYIPVGKIDLVTFMNNYYLEPKTVEELAKASGRSLSTFHRDFKEIFNETPHRWIINKRLEYAYDLLQNNTKKISEICLEVGFQDLTHFGKVFKKKYGVTPSEMQKNE